ncbi:MAG: dipeptidase [Longimicrobiales bacterium]
MTDPQGCSRRAFLRASAAAALLPALPWKLAGAAVSSTGEVAALAGDVALLPTGAEWPPYARVLVVDFLASPGAFNVPGSPPLTAEMVRNAASSGITAVNVTVSAGGADPFVGAVNGIAEWQRRIAAHADVLMKVETVADLHEAKARGRLGLVFGFQDATSLGSDVARVDTFQGLGVRVIQLTYNGRNLLGDGCLEPGNAGLSRFGHAVVERLNEQRVMVDLSHCGQRTTADAIAASREPVAITHTGCDAVHAHPRHKRDEELRAMAERGGVVGIFLMPFLTTPRAPTADDVVVHIEHALDVCGEDHVGIGSDLSITPVEGTDEYWDMHRTFIRARKAAGTAAPGEDENLLFTTEELNSPRRMELLAERLSARGHPDARIEKIIGGNWARLMSEVWG